MSLKQINVSIVVPVYNTQDYVLQCLQSIAAQTIDNLEIVVVIDAATDDSIGLVKSFQNRNPRPVQVIELLKNQGLAQARNIGIQACRGRYIGFVDSDDYINPFMYSCLLQAIEREHAQFAYCGFTKFNSQQQFEFVSHDIAENTSVCNKLFCRDFIRKNQLEFSAGELFEDELFSYKSYLLADHHVCVPRPDYFYRINPLGICRSANGDDKRLKAREHCLNDFMQKMQDSRLIDAGGPLFLRMLCRHAFLQLSSSVSWLKLIQFWRFVDDMIERYNLQLYRASCEHDYFVSRYFRWRHSLWVLWLMRKRARRLGDAMG
ncbi:glycosyltransferase family 2 protein [Alginatibacterium sediminis]|uniref:Glycosyltransferase family 2 protein n=1 Tax=Alginatibacterium sediminis TaxID=2164068 RepID=A0A420EDT2_9ALTE|nr:glycosyltransferase family 2 protein [Alginatibacterium sediminis]RKF18792.1 glycosyltransferase family 2 protein [Alginatibacterium sediminis]